MPTAAAFVASDAAAVDKATPGLLTPFVIVFGAPVTHPALRAAWVTGGHPFHADRGQLSYHRCVTRSGVRLPAIGTAPPIPVAVSAHHLHLTQAAVEQLFGAGHELTVRNALTQPETWAAEETVDVIGPRGELARLRVLGPCRSANQIEIAETETYMLGIDGPLRLSGDTRGTPVVDLCGPAGSLRTAGLIVAKRHIHMSPQDAKARGLEHGDLVEVAVNSDGRDLVFRDVAIRVDPNFVTELHIDAGEENAAGLKGSGTGELARAEGCSARITRFHMRADAAERSCCLTEGSGQQRQAA